jgi:hypothetical protein
MVGEEAVHLPRGFEISLPVGKKLEARLTNGAAVADAGEHILEPSPRGIVIVHGVGGQKRNIRLSRQFFEAAEVGSIVGAVRAGGDEGETGAEGGTEELKRKS